jgi:hypothetical protein
MTQYLGHGSLEIAFLRAGVDLLCKPGLHLGRVRNEL